MCNTCQSIVDATGQDYVRLGDIAFIEMGQSPDSGYVFEQSGQYIPFLQGNAEFGAVHPAPLYCCAKPIKLAFNNDVLISVRAPVGAVNIAETTYCIGRGLAAIRCSLLPPTLLSYILSRETPELIKVAQGTTFEAINKKDLANLPILLPDSEHIPLIARILDTLDTTIRETEAIIAKLKAVKQGLLHDLLTRGLDDNGELRPPQSEAPHLYKKSKLGWIPKEWEAVTIAHLAINHDEKRIPIKSSIRNTGAYPYYGASGVIDWVDSYIFEGNYVLLGEDGENVMSRRLPLAFLASGKFWVNNHAHIFSAKQNVDIRFLAELLEAKDYSPWVSGSAQPKITQEALNIIFFIKPALVEQINICNVLESISQRIDREYARQSKLQATKSGLMDDLLTGRVRVTSLLNDPPDTSPEVTP